MKRCSTLFVIKEMQFKLQWDTHLFEWLKLRRLTTPSISKDFDNIADENAKQHVHFGK